MTEKEKALELITKFRLFQSISYDEDGGRVNNYNISRHNAKQCAIICVEEILNELESHVYNYDMDYHFPKVSPSLTTIPYWQSVKTEIEKL